MKKLLYCFFTMILISCSAIAQNHQVKLHVKTDGVLSIKADMISVDSRCYTINMRVYKAYEGQTLLIANSNVQIGNCPQRMGNNDNPNCPDKEFKKDYFYGSKDKYKYCVVDLLEDDVTYAKYVIEKSRVINSFKK